MTDSYAIGRRVYRGTQRADLGGVLKSGSWTYSLPVAMIWSARPGDVWASSAARRDPAFLPTSTIHIAETSARRTLTLSTTPHTSFSSILKLLQYGKRDGITEDEARRVLNYLHNRLVGRAKGISEFGYRVTDEDGDLLDPQDVPLSFRNPETLISMLRDDWDEEPGLAMAERLQADAFVFADAPAVQKVAIRLGIEALIYVDVFEGGKYAAPILLGTPAEKLSGVKYGYDIEHKRVLDHETFRALTDSALSNVRSVPVSVLLEKAPAEREVGLARGQRASRRGRSAGTTTGELWYHLTDRAKFKLDAKFKPSDNAVAIEDRSGRPGIYLGRSVEKWVNGFWYWRPFVVEIKVNPSVTKDPGVHGRYGGEMFVPASSFDKLTILRVIPIDAYAREEFGEPGWIETDLGYEFDTREPLPRHTKKFRGYRYTGPDVRQMSAADVALLKKQLRQSGRLKGS